MKILAPIILVALTSCSGSSKTQQIHAPKPEAREVIKTVYVPTSEYENGEERSTRVTVFKADTIETVRLKAKDQIIKEFVQEQGILVSVGENLETTLGGDFSYEEYAQTWAFGAVKLIPVEETWDEENSIFSLRAKVKVGNPELLKDFQRAVFGPIKNEDDMRARNRMLSMFDVRRTTQAKFEKIGAEIRFSEQSGSTDSSKEKEYLRLAEQLNITNLLPEAWNYYHDSNYSKAFELFLKAANYGIAAAQNQIGFMYSRGLGTQQSYSDAYKWYKQAAENGDTTAWYNLGVYHQKGLSVQPNIDTARKLFQHAAERGDIDAEFRIGEMYLNGESLKQDYAKAFMWFLRSAKKGHDVSQNNVGWLYEHGYGTIQDHRQAAKWYQKSADQGYDAAQYNLGVLYYGGRGVARSYQQALSLFRASANQGYGPAQYNLGAMYYAGKGAPKNNEEALKWFRKAAEQGNNRAKESVRILEAQMYY